MYYCKQRRTRNPKHETRNPEPPKPHAINPNPFNTASQVNEALQLLDTTPGEEKEEDGEGRATLNPEAQAPPPTNFKKAFWFC